MKKIGVLILSLALSSGVFAQTWSELGGLNALSPNSYIRSICSDPAGNIYAAGYFTNGFNAISGDRAVAKWNGSVWSLLTGLSSPAYLNGVFTELSCVSSDASGNIYVGGNFTNSSGNYYVAKWNGSAWSELGGLNSFNPNSSVKCIFCDPLTGYIYAGGYFTNGASPTTGKFYVAKYDGASWSELGGTNGLSANNNINCLCNDAAGNIYAAGYFTNSNGKFFVAKWNGTAWDELGGLNGLAANNEIFSICSDPAGNIYAAGKFSNGIYSSDGYEYVAKWDGTSWTEVGGLNALAANDYIESIISDSKGNIYASGSFFKGGHGIVAIWNDTTWSELGAPGSLAANSSTHSLCKDVAGNIFAAGAFTNSSGLNYVAKYSSGVYGTNLVENNNIPEIFPNPANDQLQIELPYHSNLVSFIRIYNGNGKIVLQQKRFSERETIDISNLVPGVYFLTFGAFRQKFIKR
ncbi:MAG: T9SS type A sorting domain-containing protein [Bacteroidetes bacterium]|nr:T9SS type A sorting domain-containing protein [Bacteroidota bacterium]